MIVATAVRFHHLLAVSIHTASSLAADDPAKITAEKVRESYKTFTRITKEPKSVGAEFAGYTDLCDPFVGVDAVKKDVGPHAIGYLHYYLNGMAQLHRAGQIRGAYPIGSVIVKEKISAGSAFLV